MAVEVAKQGVHDKYIPEMLSKNRGRNVLLLIDGIHDVGKFRSCSAAVWIQDGVFDGTEIEEM